MKLQKLIDRAYTFPNSAELIQKIHMILSEHMCDLEVVNVKLYWKTLKDVYVAIYGPHFNEETASYAVSKLINSDGSVGQHWSYADTTNVGKSAGVLFDNYNEWDWYFTMNLMYSDYYKLFSTSDSTYVGLSKAFLGENNSPIGKAYYYWEMIMENKE